MSKPSIAAWAISDEPDAVVDLVVTDDPDVRSDEVQKFDSADDETEIEGQPDLGENNKNKSKNKKKKDIVADVKPVVKKEKAVPKEPKVSKALEKKAAKPAAPRKKTAAKKEKVLPKRGAVGPRAGPNKKVGKVLVPKYEPSAEFENVVNRSPMPKDEVDKLIANFDAAYNREDSN